MVRVRKFGGLDYPDYVLGMLSFALTVVVYTTYGRLLAVTWTDVLGRGIVIVAGAILLMLLALSHSGGLESATNKLQHPDSDLLTALTGAPMSSCPSAWRYRISSCGPLAPWASRSAWSVSWPAATRRRCVDTLFMIGFY